MSPCALVVEDSEDLASILGELLVLRGVEPLLASDGRSGVAMAKAGGGRIDIAFVDLGLPDLHGREVGRQLRALDPSLVLVALSGHGGRAERSRCAELGYDRY